MESMKKIIIGLGILLILRNSASGSSSQQQDLPFLVSPTSSNIMRECDPKGCGHFGASRGSRKHKGVDYVVSPREGIMSPIYGVVERYPDPYGDGQYSGIQIKGNGKHIGLTVKMFYLKPSVAVGQQVGPGRVVGRAQDIRLRHGGDMTNHIHVELIKGGSHVDVTNYA